ncbi:desulfoferrodoxin [candidate division KSB1 bacterium]
MTERLQAYKCGICGNIVMVMHASGGTLVCCGQNMNLLDEQTADQTTEKHVPVIEKDGNNVVVKVGSVPHPMQDQHFIEWIEAHTDDKTYIKFLKPGEDAQADFEISEDVKAAREFCNIHGLWKFE